MHTTLRLWLHGMHALAQPRAVHLMRVPSSFKCERVAGSTKDSSMLGLTGVNGRRHGGALR